MIGGLPNQIDPFTIKDYQNTIKINQLQPAAEFELFLLSSR